MSSGKQSKHLVWVDLETTGLNPDSDRILEIGVIVTDSALNEVVSLSRVLFTEDLVLQSMDPWCVETHAANGLVDACRNSVCTRPQSERDILDVVSAFADPRTASICGSSPHFDRAFLRRHMPALESWFHFRNLDVSTVRQLVALWSPERAWPIPAIAHRALPDLRASIAELRHYREAIACGGIEQAAA